MFSNILDLKIISNKSKIYLIFSFHLNIIKKNSDVGDQIADNPRGASW